MSTLRSNFGVLSLKTLWRTIAFYLIKLRSLLMSGVHLTSYTRSSHYMQFIPSWRWGYAIITKLYYIPCLIYIIRALLCVIVISKSKAVKWIIFIIAVLRRHFSSRSKNIFIIFRWLRRHSTYVIHTFFIFFTIFTTDYLIPGIPWHHGLMEVVRFCAAIAIQLRCGS